MQLDIAEVAKRSGTPASTLRFYEEKNLIRSAGRKGLRRLYDENVLQQLALIALGRAGGFSLEEIAGMLAPDGRARIDKRRLLAKADELDLVIKRLKGVQHGLRHVAACQAPDQMKCPRFLRIVRAAGAGRFEPPTDLPRIAPPAPPSRNRGRRSRA
jgi:DNA-binding transcriptional MerR regulator